MLDAGGLTEAGILKLVHAKPAESEFVDYKSRDEFKKSRNQGTAWIPQQEHAKDVCGLANGRGGLLVYGVEDIAKIPLPTARMVPFDPSADSHKTMETLHQDIRDYSAPTPVFDIFAIDSNTQTGHFYLVVVVPASPNAPHAVTVPSGQGRKVLRYSVRIPGAAGIRDLYEHEVFERYQGRLRTRAERAEQLEQVWAGGCTELLREGSHVWVAVAVVPDMPAQNLLTAHARKEIKDWNDAKLFPYRITYPVTAMDYPFPAPGRMVFTNCDGTNKDSRPAAKSTYREIHADGTAFAAIKFAQDSPPPVVLDPDDLVDDLCACIIHTLTWAGERSGGRGVATVRAALVTQRGTNMKLSDAGGTNVHGLRVLDYPGPVTTTSADLGELVDMQAVLRVAYVAALMIVQAFGQPEPAWLTEDGEINARMVKRETAERVRAWAQINKVPLCEG
ncbi:helix-turn-helix domain-containing protein [Nocardia sp. NPDC059240]|uniref:AlbA family DNA-binding domain-containing protein n=1 Tax=Nocardia sp. NPDC059240 TaxID=3346786 RepID=UPI0036BA4FC6